MAVPRVRQRASSDWLGEDDATPIPSSAAPRPSLGPTQEARRREALERGEPDPYAPNPTRTPVPTRTPKPSSTPKPTRTPNPTSTPKPTRTPSPTSTPKTPTPTRTPSPTRTPKPTGTPKPEMTGGPGSRGGKIPVRRQAPAGMPPDRWARIIAAVYDEEVNRAIELQEAGEPLTPDERALLVSANADIVSEISRWERGEPFDVEEAPVEPSVEAGAPPSLAPPNYRPGAMTDSPMDSAIAPASSARTPSQLAAETPGSEDALLQQAQRERGLPPTGAAPGEPSSPASTPMPARPPISLAPPPSSNLPSALPDDARTASARPSASSAATAPRPSTSARPSAPPPARPPQPSAPPPPPAPEPPPIDLAPPSREPELPAWEDEPADTPLVGSGSLRESITNAGGRATERGTQRVRNEIEQVRGQGYQGKTGGWRTLAQQAATGWERQYQQNKADLHPSEVRAYEADPDSLRRTILDADSPFRNYREAWIGYWREGGAAPGSEGFLDEAPATPESTVNSNRPPAEIAPPSIQEEVGELDQGMDASWQSLWEAPAPAPESEPLSEIWAEPEPEPETDEALAFEEIPWEESEYDESDEGDTYAYDEGEDYDDSEAYY